jgi:three-Cys-motif partner protein
MAFAICSPMGKGAFFTEAKESSRIKSAIVEQYFWAWTRVMRSQPKLAYIDLFAGRGVYDDGTKSTPLLVLEHAIADPNLNERLVTLFNDSDPGNADALRKSINALPRINRLKYKPRVENDKVDDTIVSLFKNITLAPTFAFIDPWGYKGLTLELIRSFLKDWGCDCVFFFNYNRINMGLDNESVEDHIDELFGESRAKRLRKTLRGLSPVEREAGIVEALMDALRDVGAEFVLPFCFLDENGTRTSHHLIFVTKHKLGYRIMKEIMAKHSSEKFQGVASFKYCPASSLHPMLFELNRPLDELEQLLVAEFSGQRLTVQEIYDQHNVGRAYTMKNYKSVLLNMERKGRIKADPPFTERRAGTFGDSVEVRFPSSKGTKRG